MLIQSMLGKVTARHYLLIDFHSQSALKLQFRNQVRHGGPGRQFISLAIEQDLHTPDRYSGDSVEAEFQAFSGNMTFQSGIAFIDNAQAVLMDGVNELIVIIRIVVKQV